MSKPKSIAVIGGGPAGMMAASVVMKLGSNVTVYEHTDRLGKKLGITGKGRCNVTNNCTPQEFLENVTKNPRFLYSAIWQFPPSSTIEYFESLGVSLKIERGARVFPETDKAKTIVDAMKKSIQGCTVIYENVTDITKNDDGSFIVEAKLKQCYDAVILATGGRSYPLTGSDGSGYKLAKKLGHECTKLIPSLIPIESKSNMCADMMGLSLKNISIKILNKSEKCLYSDFGEMMFSHFGVTGPVILSASAHIKNENISELTLSIDLKPALDEKTLDTRLLSDFKSNQNKIYSNSLGGLLPSKMIPTFIKYTGIDPLKKVNCITKEERKKILSSLKDFRIPLLKLRPIEEAIITSGGINVKEISPNTMQSKICAGLFFAGEIIDVDAYTGGFNLQIAFSTGYLAGKSAAEIE